jgi:hypothetical protein
VQQMHESNIDFRNLTSLKNALFDSDQLEKNHLVPREEWDQLKLYHIHSRRFSDIEQDLLDEVQVGDKINLHKFCDIVDLFFYLPMQKAINKNDSSDVYFILSSNVYGGHTAVSKDQGGVLKKMLDLLWIKLD